MRKRIVMAALFGGAVSLLVLVLMRTFSHLPLIAGVTTFLVAIVALTPSRRPKVEAATKTEADEAALELDRATIRLHELAGDAPPPDRPLFHRLADLMGHIRDAHVKNPDHAGLTAKFRRHVVGRMVESVSAYVDLTRRAGPDQKERLAAISTEIEAFVPVLEKIEQACLDNDLTALEINVEVLNDQLNRRR